MKSGFVRGEWLYPAHYSLLYFTKGAPGNFSRPRLSPTRCRHCGEQIKDYGGYKHIIAAKGINLSDFWDDVSPVRHKNTKWRTQNELPIAITNRIMHISGSKGMLLVDPFVGSGGSLLAAVQHGLTFVGGDMVETNCRIAAERLTALRAQLRGKST